MGREYSICQTTISYIAHGFKITIEIVETNTNALSVNAGEFFDVAINIEKYDAM